MSPSEPQVAPAGTPPKPAAAPRMGGKALLVSAATMLSRVLGLVREQLFAALLGATAFADAFVVAFRIPNLLRDLFAEGALSSAFVPTFAEHLKRSREAAFRLGSIVIGALGLATGLVTLLGIVFAPELVAVMAPGFEEVPGKVELTVLCTRVMFPFLPLVALAAVAMGGLNAQEKFGPPALASAMFNLVAIAFGVILVIAGVKAEAAAVGWSVGTLLGGAAQLLVQVPALRRTGFSFRPLFAFADPGLRRILRLMGPAVIGLAATQTNVFVNTIFASQVEGGAAWLNYAFRLMQLPIGVFGVAVATIATTGLAKRAAERDLAGMRSTLGSGLRLVAFLTVPSMIGLIALREPIVRLLFERGRFDGSDTAATGAAVLMYALGLYAYSAVKVVAPAFYALDRPRVPLYGSLAAVAVNLALNITLFPVLSYRGLALGTAAAAAVNFTVLVFVFRRTAGFRLGQLAGHLGRVFLAAVPCGAAAWAVTTALAGWLGLSLAAQLVAVFGGIGVGAVVYAAASRLLRIGEIDEVIGLVRRRLGRRRA